MNITYWLVIVVLIVLALLIIIPPLWRNREIKAADSDQRNINIAQERAKDLKLQLEAGVLNQVQYDEQYTELELSLGDDLDLEVQSQNNSSQGRWIAPVIGLLLPIFSVLIYFGLGEPEALTKAQIKTQEEMHTTQTSSMKVEDMVQRLAQRLEKDPDNAQGWIMLGRSYKHLKQFPLAVKAFKKAYELLGDDPDVMLQYADSLAMVSGGTLAGKASELVFKALEKSPDNMTGLWLGGMAKAEKGEYNSALKYWHQLEKLLPAGSQSHKEILAMIAAVQTQSIPEQTIKSVISLKVKVSLAVSLKAKVAADDTVFIYAKALTGPPMPLAIVRKKVADLPLMVTLDDAMAMMPSMKLSNFTQVKVVARVSKTGHAMKQPGDFIGTYTVAELTADHPVTIVIDKEIK